MTKILAVDDSHAVRQLVAVTLKHAGFDVFQASNGKQALDVAKESNVDIVLTDINMPVMDGVSLIQELRKLPHYQYKPILTLTTEDTDLLNQNTDNTSVTGWITKPFNPEVLLQTLKRVM